MKIKGTCQHCAYWSHTTPHGSQCKRMPPTPVFIAQAVSVGGRAREGAIQAVFPPTGADDWCGEWTEIES